MKEEKKPIGDSLSFEEAKKILSKVHGDLIFLLEKNNISDYEMYPALDVVYLMFREYLDSQDCLKLIGVVQHFELSDLVEYRSIDWWFFSALAFDADIKKITGIIERKAIEEQKVHISSSIVSDVVESDPKRI
ncbi:MAG: hypothetical protein JO014_15245 [Metakosakonia sp.]|nr:hypothetical protein [Phytobacter sp.]MBV8874065.1 hypothetical protein [Phytobacter sp.]